MGEVHVGWIDDERAMQDASILPAGPGRSDVRDLGLGLFGARADGASIRRAFCEATPDPLVWTGSVLAPDGATWRIRGLFECRPKNPPDVLTLHIEE